MTAHALLISAADLHSQLDEPDLIILDASWYLPTERQDARARYRHGHLPGARFFDIDLFSDQETELPHMAPSQGRFAMLAGQLGITSHSQIVVYDQKGLFSAARVWWLFRLFGHNRVRVLDGGLPTWQRLNLPLETGDVTANGTSPLDVQFHSRYLRGLGDVQQALSSQRSLVIDARAASRFAGDAPEPRLGVQPGHIPGSSNIPYDTLLNPNGTFRDPAEIRQLFHDRGVDGTRPVIASCGSGITAAIILLGLAIAGYPEGSLYDGSWTEWGQHPATEKALGPH